MKKVLALVMACAMIVSLATAVSALDKAPTVQPPDEEGVRIVRVDEHFGKWSGSGTVSCRIDTAAWRFEKLERLIFDADAFVVAAEKVANVNFTVQEGRTILTLSENYLKTLNKGEYWFQAEFWVDDKGKLIEVSEFINLEIPSNPIQPAAATGAAATAAPAAGAGAGGAAAGTGGASNVPQGGVALAIIPTFLAAGVALAASKKRK